MDFMFTDAAGFSWSVVDFDQHLLTGKKKRRPLGAWDANGRAFVPIGRKAPVMLYEFGRVAYHDTEARTLAAQLAAAKPATATAAERMQRNT